MSPEDRFVDRLRSLLPPQDAVLLGPGDDAAVLRRPDGDVVATTDLLVEGIDFLPGEDLERLGRRAVSVNVSDAAAMGARPRSFLLSIALPASLGEDDAVAICRGAIGRAAEFGMALAGGDLSRGPCVFISVALWGDLAGPALARSGARIGDALYLTGYPGRAAAGLAIARRLGTLATGDSPAERELLAAYRDPEPRLAFALDLAASRIPHAAIDVSDGVAIDAGRLARASGLRVVLDRDRLPVSPALVEEGSRTGAATLEWILGGGDDYELLFAAAESAAPEIRAIAGDLPVTIVGAFERGSGAVLRDAGRDRDVASLGHDHLEARA